MEMIELRDIYKTYHLGEIDVPIISLAIISNMDDGKIVFE